MLSVSSLMVLAQAAAGQVGSGRIQGGWGYVWVSYGITWGALALYSLSLWLRRPQATPGPKE
ncbi:hypothetical protein [Stigmatella ashevillensis]|nr:hypothetical protein [Stigmatella ashevillena]